jgi:cytochrome P450
MRWVDSRLRLAAIAAAPWPLVHASLTPELVRHYPRQRLTRAAYLVLYAGAVVACAVFAPWLLVPFGVVAIAGTVTGLWLMRPHAGRREGLPPGVLSSFPSGFTDGDYVARQIERFGPVSKTTLPTLESPVVCVHGLRRGADVLRQHGPHLRGLSAPFDRLIPARFVRSMEPADHARYKRIFEKAFTDAVVDARRADVVAAVRDGLEALAAGPRHEDGVAPRAHLRRIAVAALTPLVLGVERGSADFERVAEIYESLGEVDQPQDVAPDGSGRVRDAAVELEQILRRSGAEISAELASGREPAPSFVAELLRASPDALDDPNIALNLVFTVRTASTDVTGLLHWVMKMLGDHPEWGRRCREAADDDLAERIVLETLRLQQSEFIQRRVTEPIEVDGYTVRRTPPPVHESHRDP